MKMSAVNHTMPNQTKLNRPSSVQLHEQKPKKEKKNTNHSGVHKCFLQSWFHAQWAIEKKPGTGRKIKKHLLIHNEQKANIWMDDYSA